MTPKPLHHSSGCNHYLARPLADDAGQIELVDGCHSGDEGVVEAAHLHERIFGSSGPWQLAVVHPLDDTLAASGEVHLALQVAPMRVRLHPGLAGKDAAELCAWARDMLPYETADGSAALIELRELPTDIEVSINEDAADVCAKLMAGAAPFI